MEFCSNFEYDLKLGQDGENQVAQMLGDNATVEVKRDYKYTKTGNLFIEYECRGKPSCLATTKADWYCFLVDNTFIIIETAKLKRICKLLLNTPADKMGGDDNLAKGIVMKVQDLIMATTKEKYATIHTKNNN